MPMQQKPIPKMKPDIVQGKKIELKPAMKGEIVSKQPQKPKGPGFDKDLILLFAGVGLLVVACAVVPAWNANPKNTGLGMFVALLFMGGGFLTLRQARRKIKGTTEVKVQVAIRGNSTENIGAQTKTGVVNSLNIYAYYDEFIQKNVAEKIAFEYVDKPMGQPHKCINDGKSYFVHMWDIARQRLIPMNLPDGMYADPEVLALYLELPAQRKYLKHRDSWTKMIGPGILAVIVILLAIFIFAQGG